MEGREGGKDRDKEGVKRKYSHNTSILLAERRLRERNLREHGVAKVSTHYTSNCASCIGLGGLNLLYMSWGAELIVSVPGGGGAELFVSVPGCYVAQMICFVFVSHLAAAGTATL